TSSVTDGTETITFSSLMAAVTVPNGGGTNWGSPPNTESATPRALFSRTAQSVTLSFSQPISTFGVEMEQNKFDTDTIIADFFNGATLVGSVSRVINTPGAGNVAGADPSQGARLFAGSSSSASQTFTSVVLHTENDDGGFAIAQIRYALA